MNKCSQCGRFRGEDRGDCFGGPGSHDCHLEVLRQKQQEHDAVIKRVADLLQRMKDDEAKHQENMKRFNDGDLDREPHLGDHHASMHRSRFIRDLFFALHNHMP